jgi:hypothetical protein
LGIIESAAAPKAEKNAPLLLLAEDNKVRARRPLLNICF